MLEPGRLTTRPNPASLRCLLPDSCSSGRSFSRFSQPTPWGMRPCAALALHLHQIAQGPLTSNLMNIPGTYSHRLAPVGLLSPFLGISSYTGRNFVQYRRQSNQILPVNIHVFHEFPAHSRCATPTFFGRPPSSTQRAIWHKLPG